MLRSKFNVDFAPYQFDFSYLRQSTVTHFARKRIIVFITLHKNKKRICKTKYL